MSKTDRLEDLLRQGTRIGAPLAEVAAQHPECEADIERWGRWRKAARVELGELGIGALLVDPADRQRMAVGLPPDGSA